jgi:tetratricopeptide (TPR) repeat protein
VRRDLVSELSRNKGVQVIQTEDTHLPNDVKFDAVLRGTLAVEGHTGTLDLELEWYASNGRRPSLLTVYKDRCQHTDEDEWTLQADLVRSAARRVRRRMLEASVQPGEETRRKIEEAIKLSHHAKNILHRGTTKHLLAAVSSFRRAMDLDRYCAPAYAGLAEAMIRKYLYWDGDRSFLEEGREFAGRALALDPNCAQAHTALGYSYHLSSHNSDAAREYRMAIQKDKNEWLAHRLLGSLLARDGNFKEASPLLRRAMALAPTHIASYDRFFSVLQRLDRYEEALEVADKGIAAARKHLLQVPDDQNARLHMAMLFARIDQQNEAREQIAEAKRRSPKDGYTAYHCAAVHCLMDEKDEAVSDLTLAADRGYFVKNELTRNRDFDVLRGLESFQELSA